MKNKVCVMEGKFCVKLTKLNWRKLHTRSFKAMDHEPNPACHRFLKIKFYWNVATHIHLHFVYDFIRTMTAEVSSCNRD